MSPTRWHSGVLTLASAIFVGCQSDPANTITPAPVPSAPVANVAPAAIVPAAYQSTQPPPATLNTVVAPPPEAVGKPEPLPVLETLPVPSGATHAAPAEVLKLETVILSVEQTYPLLIGATLERQIADGKQLSAWGEFDLGVKGHSISAPLGFYKNYRNAIALEQPVFHGGYLYSGYKIGDGKFQPWFKERETNEGGEFSAGVGFPLLKGRVIDKRRAELFQAELARQGVEPAIRTHLLEFVRDASQVYWTWVAAGQSLLAHQELLQQAQSRVEQIEERVKAGDLNRITSINNQQLIAARESKVIEAERKLQQSAIKLSLYFRTPVGEPVIPNPTRLPTTFPRYQQPDRTQIQRDIEMAIAASPQLVELDLLADQVRVELRNAENMRLPKLDARMLASKDVGGAADPKRDKTPFELEAGLYGEVPLQRREARGKIVTARGKLSQIATKREFIVNKITTAVQDAVSALEAAAGRIERSTTNVRLARETLELARIQFDAGDIDLVELNIYEQSVTSAQLLLIAAEADYFMALADYRAALALDPLAAGPANPAVLFDRHQP